MKVDRCICFNILFEDLKKIAVDCKISSVKELQKKECFGLGCGMCIPYVHDLLKETNLGDDKVSTGLIDHKCSVSRTSSNREKIDDKT